MRLEQRRERSEAVLRIGQRRRGPEVGEAALALLADQPRVLQQAEVPRHAGLRDAEDRGQLRDVQPLGMQHPQEPQPDVVAEKAEQRRQGDMHIH